MTRFLSTLCVDWVNYDICRQRTGFIDDSTDAKSIGRWPNNRTYFKKKKTGRVLMDLRIEKKKKFFEKHFVGVSAPKVL